MSKAKQYSISLTDEQVEAIERCFANSGTWNSATLSEKIRRLVNIGVDHLGEAMPFDLNTHGGKRKGSGRKHN